MKHWIGLIAGSLALGVAAFTIVCAKARKIDWEEVGWGALTWAIALVVCFVFFRFVAPTAMHRRFLEMQAIAQRPPTTKEKIQRLYADLADKSGETLKIVSESRFCDNCRRTAAEGWLGAASALMWHSIGPESHHEFVRARDRHKAKAYGTVPIPFENYRPLILEIEGHLRTLSMDKDAPFLPHFIPTNTKPFKIPMPCTQCSPPSEPPEPPS